MLVIGSHALNHLKTLQGKTPRATNDFDAIATFNEAQDFLRARGCTSIYPINKGKTLFGRGPSGIFEIEIAWPNTTAAELLEIAPRGAATLDELYTLKMSHRYLRNSPHFLKTMRDIREMRAMGAKIFNEDWYKRRMAETYWYNHPNLDVNKDQFFNGDGVNYVYDHDSIHEAVAFQDKPMYTNYQKDGSEVLCDKRKWDALPEKFKRFAVLEESAVLALERSLIPFPKAKTPREAIIFALQKVCTSITSGWFREWAWENYEEIVHGLDKYEYDYLGLFEKAKQNGKLRPYV